MYGNEIGRKLQSLASDHDEQVLALLALSEVRGVGFETLKRISKDRIPFLAFLSDDLSKDSYERIRSNPAFESLREHLVSRDNRISALSDAKRKCDFLSSKRINVILKDHAQYPTRLLDLRDVPPWIFVEGSADVLSMPSVTAVGSRKATSDGRWMASYLGYCLPELKLVTVSGLADGIDQVIHHASLAAGFPTIAVLGTGILSDYPRGSQGLRHDIVENGGAVITEYLPKDTFSAKNFVRRNRIQAALGSAVYPVEWSLKSGTAHTVKFAFDLGRPLVFTRTPNQDSLDWVPKDYRKNGALFSLPSEHEQFILTLSQFLHAAPKQKSLF